VNERGVQRTISIRTYWLKSCKLAGLAPPVKLPLRLMSDSSSSCLRGENFIKPAHCLTTGAHLSACLRETPAPEATPSQGLHDPRLPGLLGVKEERERSLRRRPLMPRIKRWERLTNCSLAFSPSDALEEDEGEASSVVVGPSDVTRAL